MHDVISSPCISCRYQIKAKEILLMLFFTFFKIFILRGTTNRIAHKLNTPLCLPHVWDVLLLLVLLEMLHVEAARSHIHYFESYVSQISIIQSPFLVQNALKRYVSIE